jgi:fructose-1,6-bisphosphatase
MTKEEARLKALVKKLEKRAEEAEARYNALVAEIKEAHKEAQKTLKEAEEALRASEEESQRVQEETERELAWWDSVKNLPLEERVREICKHHHSHEADRPQGTEEALNLFPMGKA